MMYRACDHRMVTLVGGRLVDHDEDLWHVVGCKTSRLAGAARRELDLRLLGDRATDPLISSR